ncbi:MAG: arginyltransferase [Parvibaculaceae bacterium]
MSIERRNFPQFFITAPAPCPYLTGKFERKVFTHLLNSDAQHLHDTLSQGGFRRSQNIAYRPACEGCASCISVRIPVADFRWTRGFRRIWRANRDLATEIVPAKATSEHYSLFRYYIDQRHGEGGMVDMSVLDFTAMVEESYVRTQLVEYRLPGRVLSGGRMVKGELIATALTDVLDDGLSMIYSFYDPDLAARSLGSFMILDHIEQARRLGLSHVYLGYWVSGSGKMSYKARFRPQERLLRDGWTLFD